MVKHQLVTGNIILLLLKGWQDQGCELGCFCLESRIYIRIYVGIGTSPTLMSRWYEHQVHRQLQQNMENFHITQRITMQYVLLTIHIRLVRMFIT